MDTYTTIAYAHARSLTLHYSTSFGMSSRLFAAHIQPHIYAIYGLVRIADEIVDTYKGADAALLLNDLETETYAAIDRSYSTNPIVHAYALTAKAYDIDQTIIAPFFASMRMDLDPRVYTDESYATYIHGSAEVVGLMCLKVFCNGDSTQYKKLRPGAEALGAAYQKVNFLRDMREDYEALGRVYFPGVDFDSFGESDKQRIVSDIERDFAKALPAITQLPASCRAAVDTSYLYYSELLQTLKMTSADTIKHTRIRVPTLRKLQLFARAAIKQRFAR